VLKQRSTLEALAGDEDDNVRETAVDALHRLVGHDADTIFVAQLTRAGYQVLRAAATALVDTPNTEQAVPALTAAMQRLVDEGHDNSHDARDAIAKALESVGAGRRAGPNVRGRASRSRTAGSPPSAVRPGSAAGVDGAGLAAADSRPLRDHGDLSADELRRLAAPRARVTIRDVGTFELALFTVHAPATTLRFAHLAESGYC